MPYYEGPLRDIPQVIDPFVDQPAIPQPRASYENSTEPTTEQLMQLKGIVEEAHWGLSKQRGAPQNTLHALILNEEPLALFELTYWLGTDWREVREELDLLVAGGYVEELQEHEHSLPYYGVVTGLLPERSEQTA